MLFHFLVSFFKVFIMLLILHPQSFNPFQNKPLFLNNMSAVQFFWKHWGQMRNCSYRAISPFYTMFSIFLENSTIFIKFEIVVC